MLTKAKNLFGFHLLATDGEIGGVHDFYFDDQTWTIRYLVAETGRWLAERQVLISPFSIRRVDYEEKRVQVGLTKKQIEDSPPIETHLPVSRHYELQYAKYYGWPLYWTGPALWGTNPYPVYTGSFDYNTTRTEEPSPEPHLRNVRSVIGNYIHARDKDLGHVHDFLVDDESWAIRYLEVDTRNWWPGKKVLVAPQWIQRVSWHEARVWVDLESDAIKNAPEYDEKRAVEREYEQRLYQYYDRQVYWHNDYVAEPFSKG
jgi:stress response protein YsnF